MAVLSSEGGPGLRPQKKQDRTTNPRQFLKSHESPPDRSISQELPRGRTRFHRHARDIQSRHDPRTVHTVCSHDCPDSCGVLVTIDDVWTGYPNPGRPQSPRYPRLPLRQSREISRPCLFARSPALSHAPPRRGCKDLTPAGPRDEAFERISWDEALDIIAARLQQISNQHGPESILPYSYAGTIGVLGYGSMDRRFFHRTGGLAAQPHHLLTAGGDALLSVYGRKLGTDTEAFRDSRYIIAWGANVHGNNIHLWPMIEEARRKGAKLVVIDPYATRTARQADWHIPIRPGTDAALALGLMHIIIRDSLYDRDYVAAHAHGFDQLKRRVAEYTPECVCALHRHSAARHRAAGQRIRHHRSRGHSHELRHPALREWWHRRPGRGHAARAHRCLETSRRGPAAIHQRSVSWDKHALERPDLMLASPLNRPARVVNMVQLGHALTELDDPRVHALFVYNSNPAAVAPDQSQVVRGMARPDLFTVVHEQFFTDTADYADILLPATTFLEHKDVQGAYGHYYVQLSNQAIEPFGEARSNVSLFSELAQRMGFTEDCFRDTPDDLIAQALHVGKEQPEWKRE